MGMAEEFNNFKSGNRVIDFRQQFCLSKKVFTRALFNQGRGRRKNKERIEKNYKEEEIISNMSQKTLTDFFGTRGTLSEFSGSEDELVVGVEKDIAKYQEMIEKESQVRESSKIVPSGSGAACWNHFGHLFVSNRKVLEKNRFCKICFEEKTLLKGFGLTTSTTNYTNHLKSVHGMDVKSLNYKRKMTITASALSSTSKNTKFAHARRLAEMCCIDLQPFSIVEKQGFQKYVKFHDPGVTFPTSRTVAISALNDVYDVYLSAVKTHLKNCPNEISLVLDMWTDKYKKISYINIKVHFCENFEIKTFSLKTEHFPHPHTGKAVADNILETLKLFGLQDKNIRAVSDGGSNIVLSLKLQNIKRFGCLSHNLHLFITSDILGNKSFEHLNNILIKLKKIFRALMYRTEELQKFQLVKENEKACQIISTIENVCRSLEADDNIAVGELEMQLEDALKTPPTQCIKNSVITRWNSILKMIESFCDNFIPINMTLLNIKSDLILSDMEKKLILEFGQFLAIFAEATKYLQGQEYATISSCIYFYENIHSKLTEKAQDSSFAIIIHLYAYAKQNFFKRFKILKIHLVAALLDPCQKNWAVLNNYLKRLPNSGNSEDDFVLIDDQDNSTTKEKLILNEMQKRNIICNTVAISASEEPPSKVNKLSTSRKKMLEFVSEANTIEEVDPVEEEVKKYFQIKVINAEAFEWWRKNQELFPTIAKLANIYFGLPATSASSEVAFSVAGACITAKRSRLNPTTVQKQLFVHDNYKVFNAI